MAIVEIVETQSPRIAEGSQGTSAFSCHRLRHEPGDGLTEGDLAARCPVVGNEVTLGGEPFVVQSVSLSPVNEKMGEWEVAISYRAKPVFKFSKAIVVPEETAVADPAAETLATESAAPSEPVAAEEKPTPPKEPDHGPIGDS